MKKLLLIALLIPFINSAQTKTTVANGNFYNPGTWDCFCLPANGDNLIINHTLNMDFDIYYTSGQITINAGGSFTEGGTDRNFWADGTGTLINHGTFTAHLVAFSPGATLTNSGNFIGIDSLWNQGTFTNTGTAGILDFWNDQTATFTNTGNLSNSDSLFNQGVFTNGGSATIYDVLNDEMAQFSNSGDLTILNNMNNQGYFNTQGTIDLNNDFSNCNTQTMDAMFINDGIFCIANDMTNCVDDTLAGTGDYYIGGLSSNFGRFEGTFTFHTPSGSLDFQGGTVDPGVTFTTGTCNLGIAALDEVLFTMYPNPASSNINVSVTDVHYDLYDYSGKLVSSGKIANHQIDLTKINAGMYTLIFENHGTSRFVKN